MSMSQHTFAAVAHLAEGQFLQNVNNWLKLLTLQVGTLRLISSKEGQNLDPKKTQVKKRA